MKWVFIGGLLVFTPAAAAFLRANRRYLVHACFLVGVAIFFQNPYFSVSPIFWEWPGPVQGLQVSLVDSLAVAMLLSTPAVRIPMALKLAVVIYLGGILISSFAARQLMPVAFYVWQLGRAALLFVAIARVTARHENAPMALAAGLGCAIAIESLFVIKQFASGNSEPGGTLGHRNILGMTSHFATLPAFALLLAGYRQRLTALTVFSGMIVALLGGSRATIGLLALGLVITTLVSMRHKMTVRKGAVAAAAAVLANCAIPRMNWSCDRRSERALQSSDAQRSAMIQAAEMIIADHPLGVGADQYVIVANLGGYSDRAGIPWDKDNRSAPVHNSYFLITAELGFVGLLGLLSIFAAALATGWNALRRGVGPRSELLVGFVATALILAIHISFEWVFETATLQYLTACVFGAVIGIAASLGSNAQAPKAQRTSVSAGTPLPERA
jgi:O-antigen ligase